jgi:ssDNA-specific exonuclease RecJ
MVYGDVRENSILKFVKEKRKCTKAEVIKYMSDVGKSSTVTTQKKIMNLIDEKKLLVLKDKPNSKPHYLIINDKHEYNLINEQLQELEAHAIEMNESMDNFRKLHGGELKSQLSIRFVSNYTDLVDIMLQRLLGLQN